MKKNYVRTKNHQLFEIKVTLITKRKTKIIMNYE